MIKRYLALCLLAIFFAGCSDLNLIGGSPTATPVPYDRFTVQDVFAAFAQAGLPIGGLEQSLLVSREGPTSLKDRYLFEIPRISPAGGQIIIFANAQQQAEWETYIGKLRDNADTRRDVVYTYFHENMMLQLNSGLTNTEANSYRDAFMSLG